MPIDSHVFGFRIKRLKYVFFLCLDKNYYFCGKILKAMKKILPILMFVLLVFAGCQRGPATYQMANSPREVATNAEKFVKQVVKQSKHYQVEDWKNAVQQFILMSKNYVECKSKLTDEEVMRFDNARLQFMSAVVENGNETIAAEVKQVYGNIVQ